MNEVYETRSGARTPVRKAASAAADKLEGQLTKNGELPMTRLQEVLDSLTYQRETRLASSVLEARSALEYIRDNAELTPEQRHAVVEALR